MVAHFSTTKQLWWPIYDGKRELVTIFLACEKSRIFLRAKEADGTGDHGGNVC